MNQTRLYVTVRFDYDRDYYTSALEVMFLLVKITQKLQEG